MKPLHTKGVEYEYSFIPFSLRENMPDMITVQKLHRGLQMHISDVNLHVI